MIEEAFKKDAHLWDKNDGALDQIRLLDLAEQYDPEVIAALLRDSSLKERFFVKAGGALVFKVNDFRFFLEENRVDNTYTQYKNKIGLASGSRLFQDGEDVVLNFPYKDCILQGGQSNEEGKDVYFAYQGGDYQKREERRKEIFFNSALAYDEIDRLFDRKALVNWKKHAKDGETTVKDIRRCGEGTIRENLVVKGNNLHVLHCLEAQFAGKIKLIYIDPPYNTGNDEFKYNDNFNHSTWLVFMKNRLEVARRLLREDGAIFIQCDDNEQAYLTVLMDEIFGRGNFIQSITVKMSETCGPKMAHKDRKIVKVKETLLLFAKNKDLMRIETYPVTLNADVNQFLRTYNRIIENYSDEPGSWKHRPLSKDEKNDIGFVTENRSRIFRVAPTKSSKVPHSNEFKKVEDKFYFRGQVVLWLKDKFLDDEPYEYLGDIWGDIKTTGLAGEGGVDLKNGKKPEKLVRRIIEAATKKGDIVLDFFLGSGTTAAVAHKLGRQYIGVEQMDYAETIVLERLKEVVEGEKSGISKDIGWQGGGDFIYCELAKWNEAAAEKIRSCANLKDLKILFDELEKTYFLDYNLKIKEFKKNVTSDERFARLPLDRQKRMFVAMLDNNQMYVSKSEMADKKFKIAAGDQSLTRKFYNEQEI